ncbi:unnamed protein product, partial [Ectocarpus sp. 13 AM-2016]
EPEDVNVLGPCDDLVNPLQLVRVGRRLLRLQLQAKQAKQQGGASQREQEPHWRQKTHRDEQNVQRSLRWQLKVERRTQKQERIWVGAGVRPGGSKSKVG